MAVAWFEFAGVIGSETTSPGRAAWLLACFVLATSAHAALVNRATVTGRRTHVGALNEAAIHGAGGLFVLAVLVQAFLEAYRGLIAGRQLQRRSLCVIRYEGCRHNGGHDHEHR